MLGVISSFAKTCIWITFLSKSSWICWLTAMGALAALKAVLGIGWTPMSELPKQSRIKTFAFWTFQSVVVNGNESYLLAGRLFSEQPHGA